MRIIWYNFFWKEHSKAALLFIPGLLILVIIHLVPITDGSTWNIISGRHHNFRMVFGFFLLLVRFFFILLFFSYEHLSYVFSAKLHLDLNFMFRIAHRNNFSWHFSVGADNVSVVNFRMSSFGPQNSKHSFVVIHYFQGSLGNSKRIVILG